ncbi:MAG: T9SS type A sorting domain-containing protein [Saprospiraceae bacterium]|nr:T9SS type A sorting domain-containing protein [Saprospiraceae bacterium]
MYNFTQNGSHQICVTVFDECNVRQMCTKFEVKCDTCYCGSFSNLTARLKQGAPNQPIQCGKTYPIQCPSVFQFGGDFNCQGNGCDSTIVEWNIDGPIADSGMVPANTGFTLPLNAQSFSINGLYMLTLVGYCNGKPCPPCVIYFEVTGCDPCCKDSTAFANAIANFQTNGALGNCTIFENGTGLDSCMQVTWLWGDGNTSGPLGNATQVTHTYLGTGTYNVCYLIEVLDANQKVCNSYTKCDSIYVICDTCDCAGADHLSFGGHDFILPATCSSPDIIEIPCAANGQPFYFHGNVNCSGDFCLEDQFGWVINDTSGIYIASGSGPTQIINTSTGHFDINNLNSALFTPGVIYKITITWYCNGKKCTCDIKFRIKECDCNCGKFDNVFLRPTHGAPSIPVSCDGDTPVVPCPIPGQPFNISGQFHCVGDQCPTNTQIDWMLLDPSGNKVDFGIIYSNLGWSLNLNNHHFGKAGTYSLMLTGHCGSKLCPCKIKFTFKEACPCDDCNCGKYSKMTLKPGNGTAKSVNCGDTAVINCPGNGLNIALSGQMLCEGDSCPKTTTLDWILINSIGNQVASGNGVVVNPNFNVNVSSSLLTSSGIYTLQLIGNCGMQRCTCEVKIKMDKPCPDKCECDGFTILSAISRGPILTKNCGDTIHVPDGLNLFFSAQVNCKGICPASPNMTMTLIDPNHVSTNVTNIDENSFSLPGTYTLSIIGYCGNRVCKCSITFIKQNDCCKDESIFEQHVLSAITVTPDPAKCKVTVQVGNLPACDYIEKINWGDGTSSVGPFVTGDMPMHSYNASGVYSISIIAVEEDPAMGMYCFVKLIKKSIELNCRLIGSINPGIRPSVNDAIRVFPNPTSGLFIVELSEVPIEGTRMRVVNLAGQVMMERMAVTDIKVQSVNATSLPQGLYFIQVITSGKPIAVRSL